MLELLDTIKTEINRTSVEIGVAEARGRLELAALLHNKRMALYRLEAEAHQVYHWDRIIKEAR